jgi:hypothetical protein
MPLMFASPSVILCFVTVGVVVHAAAAAKAANASTILMVATSFACSGRYPLTSHTNL